MSKYTREQLQQIKSFPALVKYLQDELEWPITKDSFDDLTFDYEPEELGIDSKTAAKIEEIKQLRPMVTNQPWGIFFVKFEPKRLPVVALRRILSQLVVKKRASRSEQPSWNLYDLLFISNYGEGEGRQITFAQFAIDENTGGSPVLRVLGWDDADTALHIDHVHTTLKEKLQWPADTSDIEGWRNNWSSAFTLRHRETITTSKELAESLAELATSIRKRANKVMDIETEKGALRKLYKAFQQALIHDLSEDDFADMYAQTITYGLLAAKVSRPMGIIPENISDMVLTNPFLKDMLNTFLNVGGRKHKIDFDELGIQEVVELLNNPTTHIEAILRDFGNKTRQEDPVIHFYEFFLTAYDKKKKVERGVFYTPQPVVSFIVRGVHELLQTEFGLEDGLADITTWGEMNKRNKQIIIPQGVNPDEPFVLILDIATGTATFLVEVIDLIYKTMYAKWEIQGKNEKQIAFAWNEYVPKHLLPRLYGFELMMAPYAIAHMKIGLKLAETGYRFGSTERVHVYLTNTLEPHSEVPQLSMFSEALAKEADAVNKIKKDKCFTVFIGNPPYSGESKNKGSWIMNLMNDYKKEPGSKEKLKEQNPKYVNDDYVKFIRYCQHFMDKNGLGVLAFINPHGFLDNPTFRGMRWNLLKTYDNIYTIDLHGNSNKKEIASDGSVDQNVFDIMQGVSINLFAKTGKKKTNQLGEYNTYDLLGKREMKYNFLLKNSLMSITFTSINPFFPNYLLKFQNEKLLDIYNSGFSLLELFPINIGGFTTHRDNFAVDFDRNEIINRALSLINTNIDDLTIQNKYEIVNNRDWQLGKARKEIQKDKKWIEKIITCNYRPFDNRNCYFSYVMMDYPRKELIQHSFKKDNLLLGIGRQGIAVGDIEWCLVTISKNPVDANIFRRGGINLFPLFLYPITSAQQSIIPTIERTSNINLEIAKQIAENVGITFVDEKGTTEDTFSPIDILDYIYAVLHSPAYREKYKEFLKIDFPRVPYPQAADTFWQLVKLGGELRQLHLLESSKVNQFITTYPKDGRNEVVKVNYQDGKVFINETQYFAGVPQVAWEFYIGGYQPAQKWLKDRKKRELSKEDIEHYQKIIVALTETDRIMNEIDGIDLE